MKQKRWIRQTAVAAALGIVLTGPAAMAGNLGQILGAETSLYERIVNAQGGLTSTVVDERHYTAYQSEDGSEERSESRIVREEDRTTGPGAAAKVEIVEDEETEGPQVEEVSLSERYHEDYGVYEEGMGNRYFLYATVENGGITDQPVSVDIPAGLTFVMEKDGVQIPYSSGQTVSERGSYMLTLTGPNDSSLPFSEQTIYKSVFRFRIQEKLPVADEEAAEAFAPGIPSSTQAAAETVPETEEAPQEETESESMEAADESAPAEVFNEDGSVNEEALDQSLEEIVGAGESRIDMSIFSQASGLASQYDAAAGLFKNHLLTGAAFYTNVPNGMVTNSGVRLQTTDEIDFQVFLNGELLEYETGTTFDQPGSYMIYPSQNTSVYLGEYGDRSKPVFHFRIVTGPIRDMGIFNAPQDYRIKEITLDGEPLTEGISQDGGWCYLAQDGEYEIRLEHKSGMTPDLNTSFIRDSIQPRFLMSVQDSTAYFQYQSQDIAYCLLYRDGELISDSQIPAQISGSGTYRLEAYDEAGNMAYGEFQIDYHFNTGAIVVIVLVIALIVALVLFLRRARKQVRVR